MVCAQVFRWRWMSRQGPGFQAAFGLCCCLFFLESWSLVFPIRLTTVLVILAGLLIGSVVYRRTLVIVLGYWRRGFRLTVLLFLLVSLGYICVFGLGDNGPYDYDGGLYYISAIRWEQAFGVVPGLANLHYRLGYNNSLFLLVAVIASITKLERAMQISNPLVMFLIGWALVDCLQSKQPIRFTRAARLYGLLLLPAVAWLDSTTWLEIPTSDIAAAGFALLVGYALIRFFAARNSGRSWFVALTVFAITAMKLKLSYVFCAFGAVSFALIGAYLEQGNLRSLRIRSVAWLALLLIPWIARSCILSGYPLYPARLLRLHFDWTLPAPVAQYDAAWISSWARQEVPKLVPPGWGWLPSWISDQASHPEYVFLFQVFVASTFFGLLSLLIPVPWNVRRRLLIVTALPVLSLIAWFASAPDPRFAFGMFWLCAANGFFAFVIGIWQFSRVRAILFSVISTVLLVIMALNINSSQFSDLPREFPKKIPKVAMQYRTTDSGLQIKVPIEGDQVFDSGLLATPYFRYDLRLRGLSLREGFRYGRARGKGSP
jgi:hypothetical protein